MKNLFLSMTNQVDRILEVIGGFGDFGGFGKYQVFKFTTICLGVISGSLVLYALYYF